MNVNTGHWSLEGSSHQPACIHTLSKLPGEYMLEAADSAIVEPGHPGRRQAGLEHCSDVAAGHQG